MILTKAMTLLTISVAVQAEEARDRGKGGWRTHNQTKPCFKGLRGTCRNVARYRTRSRELDGKRENFGRCMGCRAAIVCSNCRRCTTADRLLKLRVSARERWTYVWSSLYGHSIIKSISAPGRTSKDILFCNVVHRLLCLRSPELCARCCFQFVSE